MSEKITFSENIERAAGQVVLINGEHPHSIVGVEDNYVVIDVHGRPYYAKCDDLRNPTAAPARTSNPTEAPIHWEVAWDDLIIAPLKGVMMGSAIVGSDENGTVCAPIYFGPEISMYGHGTTTGPNGEQQHYDFVSFKLPPDHPAAEWQAVIKRAIESASK